METREQFLRLLWDRVINARQSGRWIDATISAANCQPNSPFADAGHALARLLGTGADRTDLSLVARGLAYEAVFSVLYMLGDPGVLGDDVLMLHESLLSADPSGREGRPSSLPNG